MNQRKQPTNVSKLPKRTKPNFGLIIIGALFIYMIVLCINFLGKEKVSIYEVTQTKVSDTIVLNALAVRKEKVINAQSAGYISYVKAEGEKLGVHSKLYAIDHKGNLEDQLTSQDEDQSLSTANISKIRTHISSFQNKFTPDNYSSLYDFKYETQNLTFEQKQSYLLDSISEYASRNPSAVEMYSANQTGVVSYSIDGYEGLKVKDITEDLFSMAEPAKTQLTSQNQVSEDSNIAKIITSETWSVVIQASDKMKSKIEDKTSVTVRFLKDDIELKGYLTYRDVNGISCAEISFTHDMERYMNDRVLKIELCADSAEGLKVPKSAMIKQSFTKVPSTFLTSGGDISGKGFITQAVDDKKQIVYKFTQATVYANIDDFLYVDESLFPIGTVLQLPESNKQFTISEKGELEGVYRANEGYCKFCHINKVYENAEYCVALEGEKYSLSLFDHIVLNPERLSENDFIK